MSTYVLLSNTEELVFLYMYDNPLNTSVFGWFMQNSPWTVAFPYFYNTEKNGSLNELGSCMDC